MNYFLDTEFLEDGETIDLISIAVVSEDGRQYYAVSLDFDMNRLFTYQTVGEGGKLTPQGKWLWENVVTKLPPKYVPTGDGEDMVLNPVWKTRSRIAADLIEFCGESPMIWADYAAYDWVALCQLFGPMIDLPPTWPMFCRDVQNLKAFVGYTGDLPEPAIEHDAMSDAHNVMTRWYFLNGLR